MIDCELTVDLRLIGPILSQSNTPQGYGIDAPMARTARGEYCLPGSQVKGRLRQALEQMADLNLIGLAQVDEWLGKSAGSLEPGSELLPIEPQRGLIGFEDFVYQGTSAGKDLRFRIALDAAIGSVKKGAMLMIESPFAPGGEYTFRGVLQLTAADVKDAEQIRLRLQQAFRLIGSIGAERTTGFGRLKAAQVAGPANIEKAESGKAQAASVTGDLLGVELTPTTPFCIAKHRADDNVFETETEIPGGAIKGALAQAWLHRLGKPGALEIGPDTDPSRPMLSKHFSRLRFSHAFPGGLDSGIRPAHYPLSLITVKERPSFADLLYQPHPVIVRGGDRFRAPAFEIDWKGDDPGLVGSAFGWPDFEKKKLLRVRTAINPETLTAKEAQLFSMETVVPDGLTWRFHVDLEGVPKADRDQTSRELQSVFAFGLRSLGKTKAHAGFGVVRSTEWPVPEYAQTSSTARPGEWAVTLQTAALLCDPETLTRASGDAELRNAYQSYWTEASGGLLQLERFFAGQSLGGGFYLYRRFQDGNPYRPWLLTNRGSVFLLRTTGDAAIVQKTIDRWLRTGLPLPTWATERYRRAGIPGNDWRTCPYIPENGYGEIAVNMKVHQTAALQTGEFQDIANAL